MKLPPVRAFLALLSATALGAELPKESTPVLVAMKAELERSLATLKPLSVAPYFLSYEITESNRTYATSAFGGLVSSGEGKTRLLDIDLRVGDYALDNTHPLRGISGPSSFSAPIQIPIDDAPDAIRAVLWYQTDRRYKAAVEQLTKVKTNVRVKVAEEDRSADFCAEPAEIHAEPVARLAADKNTLEDKVRRYTAPFAADPNIYAATASISVGVETRWYANSEGALIQVSEPACRITLSASTKAEDGMELPRHETFFAFSPDALPSDEVVLAKVKKMMSDLTALRSAPIVEPYTGPAILSGRAAGVFFHEVFGHRAEGHRQKNVNEGQTFKKQLNQSLLPAGFTVYSDPTLDRLAGRSLGGHYLYDNQGVKARRVNLVEHGILKSFLMARMPIEGFAESNGHGRKQAGYAPVARQSNLVIAVDEPLTHDALKAQLLALMQQQNKPYGLLFEDIEGGFTMTGRTIPNAFNVLPIMVYRVYPDGREELVRGVDLIGTPLTTFSKVVAADDQPDVFNGVCGAESGGVPVSAVSPGLLLSQIEVQKKQKSQDRIPVLPAPATSTVSATPTL